LRKALIALAAVPVVAALYLPLLVRRNVAARVALVCGAGAIIVAGALAVSSPREVVATKPAEILAIPAAAFRPLVVSHGLVNPIIVDFTAAMDRASVEAALSVEPSTPVTLAWSDDSSSLAVRPSAAWRPATLHTIAIGPDAHDAAGTPVGRELRSIFMTRPGVRAALALAGSSGTVARVDSGVRVTFDAPIDLATAMRSFRVDPPVAGTWTQPTPTTGQAFLFTPVEPLRAGTTYTFSFAAGASDAAGAPLTAGPVLTLQTEPSPAVVRFRPRAGWTDVARDQDISVRFNRPMNRTATRSAFSVTIGGKAIAGSHRWAEGDRVLVFAPAKPLPYGAKVVMRVDAGARSRAGTPIAKEVSGTFNVEKRPVVQVAAAPRATTTRSTTTTPISRPTGGTATGSATWLAVEKYYFKLLTCTRGGGLVTSGGACSSPGGSGLRALKLDAGISAKVARPYARKIAQAGVCDHFYGGTNPGQRLKRAGYSGYAWGENIGCRSGNAYAAVLGSHRFFQDERSYNGGHWKNMMNPRYDRVGIGVWVSSGRVRLVIDFYHP
jgi:uncharacterized protein YkwD